MERINDILKDSSLPGISRIIKIQNKLIKFIWVILLILLYYWCGIFLASTIKGYLDYEVVSNINVYHELSSPFPAISFCIYSKNVPNISEFMFYCFLDFKKYSWEDFQIYSFFDQVCYRFNSGKNYYNKNVEVITTTRTEPSAGFQIALNSKGYTFNEYGPFKIKLFIQNSTTVFRRDQSYNIEAGILIPAGTTYIKIEREFDEKLTLPYNNCVKQDTNDYVSNLFQFFIYNNKTYLQKDCFDLCIEEILKTSCNCSADLGKTSVCFEKPDISKCIWQMYYAFKERKLKFPDQCYLKCPLECDYLYIKTEQIYLGIFSDDYLKSINFSDSIKDDLIYINIYYPYLQYRLLKEIPKLKAFDLISNIGGVVGLFTGVCFISLGEIVELFSEIFISFMKKKIKSETILPDNH